MNVCMFTNTYLPHVGGVANSISILEADLRALGHRVMVVAPVYPGENGSEDVEGRIVRIPAIQNFNGSDFSLGIPTPFKVSENVEAFAPAVVHSHHPYLLGDTALRAAKQRGLPLVFTHHTRYEEYVHYVSENASTLREVVKHLSVAYANLCSAVVAPSESVAGMLRRRGVECRVEVIPTGVDLEFFASGRGDRFREACGLPRGVPVIGHLGRLAPEKNLDFLSEAVAGVMESRPDVRFLVIGDGPSRRHVTDRFEERGLASRLVMAGRKTGKDLRDGYHAMDLFVFSSRSETQGMVLTEAMASGVPVVALDAPGAREVVRDGRDGRLLPPDASPADFARAVSQLVGDPDRLGPMAAAARRRAADFDRRTVAGKMAGLYRELAEAGPRPHEENDPLADLGEVVRRVKAEWDLVSGKVSALASALGREEEEGKGG